MTSRLEIFGSEQSLSDPCVYRLFEKCSNAKLKMIVIAYAGDLIAAEKANDADELRKHLHDPFTTKTLGELKRYNSCLLLADWKRGVPRTLQNATIDKLLDQFGITSSSPLSICSSFPLRARGPEEEGFDGRYREVTGRLLWIANMSRSNISNAVRKSCATLMTLESVTEKRPRKLSTTSRAQGILGSRSAEMPPTSYKPLRFRRAPP